MLPSMLFAALLATSPAATPQSPRPAMLGLCAACHGTDGQARVPGTPNLAGQKADYLLAALRQYRNGKRDHAVMRGVVGSMRPDDMQELARWYAAQPTCAPETL